MENENSKIHANFIRNTTPMSAYHSFITTMWQQIKKSVIREGYEEWGEKHPVSSKY